MRILAVADIHSRQDRLLLIQQAIRRHCPDVLVVAGDVSSFFRPTPILDDLEDLGLRVLVVRGNTDRPDMEKLLLSYKNVSSLHLREIVMDRIRFVGVGGTILLPFRSRLCIREKRMMATLETIVHSRHVVVTHPPPFGTLDEVAGKWHAGSSAVSALVDARNPRMLLCGHIHERPGIVERGKTLVVNCSVGKSGAGVLIEMDEENIFSAERI